ncbi:MAG: SGNH/GDSL hydrolase family protein [Solirubrobacteraceae bacterium]
MLRRRSLVAALCAFGAALAPAAGAGAADPGPYVALGDSFTAAPLVLNQGVTPLGCFRSDRNYPSIVAFAIGVTQFRDASCSGATTEDMTRRQPVLLSANIPQFDALRPDATLVTVGIGGNDVGLVGAVVRCLGLGLLAPTGKSCRRAFAKKGGGDRLAGAIDATGPKIAATLDGIHARAPLARVLLVGYPNVAPDGKGCFPLVPLSPDDLVYLDEMLRRTNSVLARQAAANGAEYVDTYSDSGGHDVCSPPGTRWFEGVVPTRLAAPVHPNAYGAAAMARSVLRVLGRPQPEPVLGSLARSRATIAAGRALRVSYTLSRAASVTFALRRSRGRGRYTAARALVTVNGRPGDNAVPLSPAQLGRRPGLYRLTAALATGATQAVHFRIRRAR